MANCCSRVTHHDIVPIHALETFVQRVHPLKERASNLSVPCHRIWICDEGSWQRTEETIRPLLELLVVVWISEGDITLRSDFSV